MPGSLARGFLLDCRSVCLKEVNVLGRVGRDRCQVQDLFNTQITEIDLANLRTVKELWDFVAKDSPALLPRGMREPVSDRTNPKYWRVDQLPKAIMVKAFQS